MDKPKANPKLPKEATEEFKKIYRTKFGQALSDEEVIKRANNLFGLYQAVYGFSSNKLKSK